MPAETIARGLTFALLIAGTSMLAAPEQTATPGQMTRARVWIENRGRAEAIPVELRDVGLDAPLKVHVVNGDPAFTRATPLPVAQIRVLWDYETITVLPADDVAKVLNGRGALGWETTGIAFAGADKTTLLLKRPRLP